MLSLTGYVDNICAHEGQLQITLDEQTVEFTPDPERILHITAHARFCCCHCKKMTKKLYAQAYCFVCFRSLARCDLCFVSPTRCHYAQGTCREPSFAERYCMTPHVLYLAWTAHPKVGLTRAHRLHERLREQGALLAAAVAYTTDRRAAGHLEATLSTHVAERTHWKKMLQTHTVDPEHFEATFQQASEHLKEHSIETLPYKPIVFDYPILGASTLSNLNQAETYTISSPLIGIKGLYLLFPSGVISLRQWQGRFLSIQMHQETPLY